MAEQEKSLMDKFGWPLLVVAGGTVITGLFGFLTGRAQSLPLGWALLAMAVALLPLFFAVFAWVVVIWVQDDDVFVRVLFYLLAAALLVVSGMSVQGVWPLWEWLWDGTVAPGWPEPDELR